MADLAVAQLRRLLSVPISPENDRAQDAWEASWPVDVQRATRLPESLHAYLTDFALTEGHSLNDEIIRRCSKYQENPVTAAVTAVRTIRDHIDVTAKDYPTVVGVLIQGPERHEPTGDVRVVYQHVIKGADTIDHEVCDSGSVSGAEAEAAAFLAEHAEDVAALDGVTVDRIVPGRTRVTVWQ